MIQVQPLELHDYWAYVRTGLNKVRGRAGGDWIPEDVYTAIKNGNSNLYMFDNGFCVITPVRDFDGLTAYIWAAYCEDGLFEINDVPEIIELCRGMGAKRIRWDSKRKGWARRYKVVSTTYEKEL